MTPFEEGTDGDGVSGTFDMGTRRQEIFSPGTWFSQQHYHGSIEQKMNGILQYIRETYSGRPISTIGFCWGGYALCHFAKSAPEIVSGVIAHPRFVTSTLSFPIFTHSLLFFLVYMLRKIFMEKIFRN